MKIKNISLIFIAVATVSSVILSCTGGGGGGSVTLGADPQSVGNSYSIAITKIQSVTSGSWSTDNAGKVYVSSNIVTVEGTCSRGVATISATSNTVAVAETATCDTNGAFSWSKTFAAGTPATGTTYDLVFQALGADGSSLSGATDSKSVVVDTSAPTAPTIDPVSGCTLSSGVYVCSSTNIDVTGSWSGAEDVVSVQVPSSGTTTYPTSTTFDYAFTLTEGQSRTLNFTVKDRAGNISGISTTSVTYSPSVNPLATSVNTGGTSSFAGGPVGSAASMIGNVGSMSGQFYDTISGAANNLKVQLFIGPVAVGSNQINP